MGNGLKIVIFICGFLFTFTVIMLLVKNKISERNTIVWLTGCIVILVLSVNPDMFDALAVKVGVKYPPALLFLISTLILLFVVLYQSIQISTLSDKVRELAQYVAVLHYTETKQTEIKHDSDPIRDESMEDKRIG